MTNVTELDDYRPHETFRANCVFCEHEWQAVVKCPAPKLLECPNCGGAGGAHSPTNIKSEPAP